MQAQKVEMVRALVTRGARVDADGYVPIIQVTMRMKDEEVEGTVEIFP